EKENCCQQHHIDLAHQQKFRIRTGNGDETVAPRSSADFVKLAANKRVFLMGDSMTNQVFEVLYADMDHLGIKVVEMDLRHKFHVDDNENGFEVWWRRFYVPFFIFSASRSYFSLYVRLLHPADPAGFGLRAQIDGELEVHDGDARGSFGVLTVGVVAIEDGFHGVGPDVKSKRAVVVLPQPLHLIPKMDY
ncbi:hypothetical protein HDU77_001624, partial [Chytriomyces hyalinus]